jgi:hypothetical protein
MSREEDRAFRGSLCFRAGSRRAIGHDGTLADLAASGRKSRHQKFTLPGGDLQAVWLVLLYNRNDAAVGGVANAMIYPINSLDKLATRGFSDAAIADAGTIANIIELYVEIPLESR